MDDGPDGDSSRGQSRDRRSRRAASLFFAATLTVATGVFGAPARAASGPTVEYSLSATNKNRMCIGVDDTIDVWIERLVTAPDSAGEVVKGGFTASMNDVVVEASISDPSVLATTNATQITGLDNSRPARATFTFQPKKEGVATVTFTARISAMGETDGWKGNIRDRSVDVEVKVTHCRFEVGVASVWRLKGDANIGVVANIDAAELAPDGNGEYRTLGDVTWFLSVSGVGDCYGTLFAKSTDAPIFATLDDNGNLTVDITYDPVTVNIAVQCGSIKSTFDKTLQAEALHVVVPSSGGHGVAPQRLDKDAGRAIYSLVPIDK